MYEPPLVLEFREMERPFFVLSYQYPGSNVRVLGFVWTELEGDLLHDRARFAQCWGHPATAWQVRSVENVEPTLSAPRIEDLLPKVVAYLREAARPRKTRVML